MPSQGPVTTLKVLIRFFQESLSFNSVPWWYSAQIVPLSGPLSCRRLLHCQRQRQNMLPYQLLCEMSFTSWILSMKWRLSEFTFPKCQSLTQRAVSSKIMLAPWNWLIPLICNRGLNISRPTSPLSAICRAAPEGKARPQLVTRVWVNSDATVFDQCQASCRNSPSQPSWEANGSRSYLSNTSEKHPPNTEQTSKQRSSRPHSHA